MRQTRERPASGGSAPEESTSSEPWSTREAAGTLLAQLSPQERAAVVLEDVFDLPLEETADALSTSTGAIKAALHRGRTKLAEPDLEEAPTVAPAVLDAFCDAFNARDLDRLTALLLHGATMEFPGIRVEHGAAALREGSLRSTLFGCPDGGRSDRPPAQLSPRAGVDRRGVPRSSTCHSGRMGIGRTGLVTAECAEIE